MSAPKLHVERFLPLTRVAFEILLAVAEDECHGYDIMLAIGPSTGGRLSLNTGTLYRALRKRSGPVHADPWGRREMTLPAPRARMKAACTKQ